MKTARYLGGIGLGFGLGLGLAVSAGAGLALADTQADTAGSPDPGSHRRSPQLQRTAQPNRVAVSPRAKRQAVRAVTSLATTGNGITVNPTVEFVGGMFRGTLQASNSRNLPMTYSSSGGDNGGKLTLGAVATDPQSYTALPYATWLDGGVKGVETFQVRVSEVTPVDQFLVGLPVIGAVAGPVINLLQQLPMISDLLAPIIGASVLAAIEIDVAASAPADTPLAFTYKVTSFDGTLISTNFFPATDLAAGEVAPTVLEGPGLGGPGATTPSGPANIGLLTPIGYNMITWDPRGEFASGGVLQMDNPNYEARDASAIITWATASTPTAVENGDPRIGMVGGSYGGAIQLVTAATDPRVDAIVPLIAWNSLNSALYPYDTFEVAWPTILTLLLVQEGARVNSQLYKAVLTGDLFGWISETSQAFLGSSGSTALLNVLRIPTLLVQGTVDTLVPLSQAVANAEAIMSNGSGAPVKMTWFCGGHGTCLDPVNPGQEAVIAADLVAWMNQYVAGNGRPADEIPAFQWFDQRGDYYASSLLPFQDGFNQPEPYTVSGAGGTLGIVPYIGGSGPLPGVAWPLSWIAATKADNAINVAATPEVGSQIVGAPQVSFTYSGLGTSRAVFAQLVDTATGRVVGNQVSPVPVTLDGQTRTVSVPMYDIAYTVETGDSLTLQITSSATLYENSSFGVINIWNPQLDLPLRAF
ncbi:MAG: S15 peptidase family protein [Mycobacterium sp.]